MDDHGITSSVQDDVTTVKFCENEAFDPIHSDAMMKALNQLAESNDTGRFVIDLSNISLMPSSAIGMLVTLHETIANSGRKLSIRNLTPDVLESFQFLHLDRLFDIEDLDNPT